MKDFSLLFNQEPWPRVKCLFFLFSNNVKIKKYLFRFCYAMLFGNLPPGVNGLCATLGFVIMRVFFSSV